MISGLPGWSDRRLARCLIAWWILSLALLAVILVEFLFPVDAGYDWFSLTTVFYLASSVAVWMVPGLLLGGWKVLLVASGRSSIRTATDKGFLIVFALWAIGWPTLVVFSAAHAGAF